MFDAYNMRYKKYGAIYKERYAPAITIVVVTDYKEYSKVMRADGKMPTRIPLEPLLTYRLKNKLGAGMVNGNGETWYKYRTAINKKMLRPKEVVQYMEPMDDVAKDLVELLALSKDDNAIVHDLNDILFRWSMESVNTFLLDARLGTLKEVPDVDTMEVVTNIIGVFRCMQKLMFDLPFYKSFPTPMWRKFENHCGRAIGASLKIVNQRLEELNQGGEVDENKRQCLVSYLLAGQGLSNFEIGVMLVELMVGSVETASNSLMWTLYLLSKNPGCQQTLFNEVQEVLGSDCDVITPEMMEKLRYTKACIKEAQRLYPVTFATSRLLNEDVEILGYRVPAGTHIQANTCTLCRNGDVFSQPNDFIPERWLNERSEDMGVVNLVWGHGARMCIGRRLAEQEMHLGLARIISRFHVFYPELLPPEPVLHTVMTSSAHMSMKFIERSSMISKN
ncbi:cytochrome P450 10-like [Watersipora subatra]|uniref:cytochrome P450 10-like n=1 Tax=Watersipora subatra TaxID=2589382 RepID=UPI00355B9E80